MGIETFPAAGGGGIKSVQRGVSSTAESVTITSVNIDKSFVRTFSTGANPTSVNVNIASFNAQTQANRPYASTIETTSNFAVSTYGAYLSNSTTLVTTGPCRWEVVEFN